MWRRRLYETALVANAILLLASAASFRAGYPDAARFAAAGTNGLAAVAEAAALPQGGPVSAHAPPLQLQPGAPLPPPPLTVVPPPPAPAPGHDLAAQIMAAISSSSAKTAGVVVEVEGLGRVLESNPATMMLPASAQKLRTAGVAMLKLGPDYRFRTEVLGWGEMTPDGVLHGDLVLVGGGDPALGRPDLAALAASLHSSGLRLVEGGVWGDEGRYDAVRGGPGWKPKYLTHQSGALSALAVDGNQYRNDPSFIADPVSPNVDLFREALRGTGIGVNGPTRTGRPGAGLRPLASHYSPPLAALIGPVLKESNNFFAEMVLKELGRTIGKPTTQGGAEVVRATVAALGVPPGEIHDGSGLSRLNRQSAANEVLWLRAIEGLSFGPHLRSSLAMSCVAPGTLKKRFCGTPGAGQVIGKTGALPGSAVLVGYTTTASGRATRFSFMLSGNHSNRQARDAIDRAILAIREFRS